MDQKYIDRIEQLRYNILTKKVGEVSYPDFKPIADTAIANIKKWIDDNKCITDKYSLYIYPKSEGGLDLEYRTTAFDYTVEFTNDGEIEMTVSAID